MARSRPKDEAKDPDKEGVPHVEEAGPALPPLVEAAPVAKAEPPDPGPPVAVERFRVEQERRVMHGGAMVLLRAGKAIDGSQYDLESLRSQGVRLSRIP